MKWKLLASALLFSLLAFSFFPVERKRHEYIIEAIPHRHSSVKTWTSNSLPYFGTSGEIWFVDANTGEDVAIYGTVSIRRKK